MFLHNPVEVPFQSETECVTVESGRTYTQKGHSYPSITTVLKDYSKEYIDKWKERVGTEKAALESERAKNRGNDIHEMCEKYIQNVPLDECNALYPQYKGLFRPLKNQLDKHVNNIAVQEKVLFSNKLKVAGRVDCIAEWDGVRSIIDFKGSNKIKKESWIDSYKIQTTFYSLAFYEQTGIAINQCVILLVSDGSAAKGCDPKYITDFGNVVKPYIFKPKEYYGKLKETIDRYYAKT